MNKKGYYIFNTFIVLIFIVLQTIISYCAVSTVNEAAVEVALGNNTDEEIIEQYKDNEDFNNYYEQEKENIENHRKMLNEYEAGTKEFTSLENEVNYEEENIVRTTLESMYFNENKSATIGAILVIDLVIAAFYVIGMFIYVKVQKSKEEKQTKKVARKTTKKTK